MRITKQHHTFKAIRTVLGNALFPPYCVLCHASVDASATVCNACFAQLRMISHPYCEQCSQPFPYAMGITGEPCTVCQFTPPDYDAARAVWCYDDASAGLVKKLKYSDHTRLAPYLAGVMRGQGAELLEHATMIAPVPLHRKRIRYRRYNQAMLLAKEIHRHQLKQQNTLHLIPNLLQRIRYTPPQTTLTHEERQRNVAGVFGVHPAYGQALNGARVILVDDVITTGATLNACAISLKKSGAAWVGVLTLAKRVKE